MRFVLALCVALAPTFVAAQQKTSLAPGGIIRVLDKVSGQTRDIELASGQSQRVGRLTVRLSECRYPEGNRSGDAYAGLQITEIDRDTPVFDGWMIASAPALSALDHAQFDVWVIRCITS